eukprot:TRINITY_DN12011_c0_g1_i1.p1 TRINITY_DN12011_c0_g1~~TRINITY_DN12011_c0_g1_i1.p1  ORF type:complete len:217 (-),score=53.51 TRINITY_DN12011_c0_g1_i1:52-702(-)
MSSSSYNEAYRILLQYLMANQIVSKKKLKEMYPNENFDDIFLVINNQIRFVFLEIKKVHSDVDNEVYYGLVNTKSDEFSQMATNLDKKEIDMFKLIIDKVVTDEYISWSNAVSLRGNLDSAAAQIALDNFIKNRWLREENTNLYFGIRTYLELTQYFAESYDFEDCKICSETVIHGENCSNDECTVIMHKHCSNKWFEQKSDPKCPDCKTPWGNYS